MPSKLRRDESLIAVVVDLISEEDKELANRFEDAIGDDSDLSHSEEVIKLNSFLRRQLSRLPVNTISERECLVDEIDANDWLRHFRAQVLPTVLRFKIPRAA